MSYDYDGVENSEEWSNEVEEIEELSEVETFREEFLREYGGELPDLPGIEDILKIENPETREKEIEKSEKLKEEETRLIEDCKSGKIDQVTFEAKYFYEYLPKESRFETRCALESVGITYGKLSQLSGQYQATTTGDPDWIDLNDRVDRFIENDPEYAQEVADEMYEEGRLSEKGYNVISEKVGYFK